MKKEKLNIIKLNIIAMILTLICTSCAPFSKIDPKANENTNLGKNTNPEKTTNLRKNIDLEKNTNLGKNTNPEKTTNLRKNIDLEKNTNPEENTQNFEDEFDDFRSYYENLMGTTDSKLKEIGKKLETQNNKYNIQIDKITKEQLDFLDNFVSHATLENEKMLLKKMIYSSLDYKKENIETLKTILETLKNNHENTNMINSFLYYSALGIQIHLDKHLQSINEELETQSKEDLEMLLELLKFELQLKEMFKKGLKETLEAYRQNTNNIKDNAEALAEHFNKYCQSLDSFEPIY